MHVSGPRKRNRVKKSVEINLCDADDDSKGSNGCDSTVKRGRGNRRGAKNGYEATTAVPVVNGNVSSTRGRRGRRGAAKPITSAARRVPQVILSYAFYYRTF